MTISQSEAFIDHRHLLFEQIKDLFDTEYHIEILVKKMARKATSNELKDIFERQRFEIESHIGILLDIFVLLGHEPEKKISEGCLGLLKDCKEVLDAYGPASVIDTALILLDQRVEHFEIAGYGGAAAVANHIGEHNVADLLNKVLAEKISLDAKLGHEVSRSINTQASNFQSN